MAWQDSHFSLSYDRPSTTAVCQPDIAYREDAKAGDLSYFETLCRIIALALEVVRLRMLSPHSQIRFESIQGYKERIKQIMVDANPHLRDAARCSTSTEHLERVVLKLHSSYFSSELCRPALKQSADPNNPDMVRMRQDCVSNLMMTVEAYIEMHNISSHAARSWIALQRAISSAFLLAVIEEAKSDSNVWNLLRQLEGIIAQRAASERAYDTGEVTATTTAASMTSPSQGMNIYDPITGATNPPGLVPPAIDPASPAAAPESQTQWAKSLAKTHRALQKLLAAFGKSHGRPSARSPAAYPSQSNTSTAAGSMAGLAPPVSGGLTPSYGSLPPPTPESSGSGEWTTPNLFDRASEYIHPPLWS